MREIIQIPFVKIWSYCLLNHMTLLAWNDPLSNKSSFGGKEFVIFTSKGRFFLAIDWKKSPNCEFKSFFQVSWVTWFKRQQHLIFHKWQPPKSHTRRFDSNFSHNSKSYDKFGLPYEDRPRAVMGDSPLFAEFATMSRFWDWRNIFHQLQLV